MASSILKKDEVKRYTLGIVYEPKVVDLQDDFATAEEIEKACWEFMRAMQGKDEVTKTALELIDLIVKALDENNEVTFDISEVFEELQKASRLGLQHESWDDPGVIVECYCAPVDFILPSEQGPQVIKKGTWLMGCVWTEDNYDKVLNGELTGLSMGGKAKRVPVIGVN
jgi:hypothetical protein